MQTRSGILRKTRPRQPTQLADLQCHPKQGLYPFNPVGFSEFRRVKLCTMALLEYDLEICPS